MTVPPHKKKPLDAGQFQESQYERYSWEHCVQAVLEGERKKKNSQKRMQLFFTFCDLLYAQHHTFCTDQCDAFFFFSVNLDAFQS